MIQSSTLEFIGNYFFDFFHQLMKPTKASLISVEFTWFSTDLIMCDICVTSVVEASRHFEQYILLSYSLGMVAKCVINIHLSNVHGEIWIQSQKCQRIQKWYIMTRSNLTKYSNINKKLPGFEYSKINNWWFFSTGFVFQLWQFEYLLFLSPNIFMFWVFLFKNVLNKKTYQNVFLDGNFVGSKSK